MSVIKDKLDGNENEEEIFVDFVLKLDRININARVFIKFENELHEFQTL